MTADPGKTAEGGSRDKVEGRAWWRGKVER